METLVAVGGDLIRRRSEEDILAEQVMLLQDNSDLIRHIKDMGVSSETVVPVQIDLPDYLDITSLLALEKRMVETVKLCGCKLRLVGKTKNIEVEKYATRIFATRNDIFLSVDWS